VRRLPNPKSHQADLLMGVEEAPKFRVGNEALTPYQSAWMLMKLMLPVRSDHTILYTVNNQGAYLADHNSLGPCVVYVKQHCFAAEPVAYVIIKHC
jgi:hypothetical protein